jgi:phosphatidate phosphatase APP1
MPIGPLSPRDAEKRIVDLSKGNTGGANEKEIVDTLAALAPPERAEVVRLLEGRNGHHTLDHIIKDDIDDPTLRQAALRLIGEARPFLVSGGRVVVSDIDDTVKPSKDPTVKGEVYPGAKTFYAALDAGKDGNDASGDIHFVTARDGVVVQAGHTLSHTGIDVGSISYGNTFALMLAGIGIHKGIENEKVKDILNLMEKNPTRQLVLLGDTVQADASVFRRVLQEKPERVEVVLLHAVKDFKPPDDMKNNPKVVIFADYADAAEQMHARGAISTAQRDAVLAEIAQAPTN